MQMCSYSTVTHAMQKKLHSYYLTRYKKTGPKITQARLHANAFLDISDSLTHACTRIYISALPVHTLSQVYAEALRYSKFTVFERLGASDEVY